MSSPYHEHDSYLNRIPSLEALHVFHEVARQRSFSAASATLHVTQGAVSHRVRGLEEALGVQLFVRGRRGVELTDQGRILFQATDQAMQALEGGLRSLLKRTAAPSLVLGCSPSFTIRWLVPHLPELRSRHPGLDVRIAAIDLPEDRPIHDVDLAVRYGPPLPGEDALGEVRVLAVCSPGLTRGPLPLQTPADLVHHTLLHDEVLSQHPDWVGWRRWLDLAGAPEVSSDRGLRFSHSYMAIEAALAGQGVALARAILVARDLREGRLCCPFAFAPVSRLGYHLRVSSSPTSAQQAVALWLHEAVRRDSEGLMEISS